MYTCVFIYRYLYHFWYYLQVHMNHVEHVYIVDICYHSFIYLYMVHVLVVPYSIPSMYLNVNVRTLPSIVLCQQRDDEP